MRMTLLQMVQDIADSLVSDSVNSVTGTGSTEEGTTIAGFIKTTYYEILDRQDWSFLHKMKVLDGLSDTDHPNYLKVPAQVSSVKGVMYDRSTDAYPKMRPVQYLDPDEFIKYLYNNRPIDANVTEVVTDFGGIKLLIRNDKFPDYYTSFDDKYLVFDSYHSDYDTTLMSAKSLADCVVYPSWSVTNTFVPEMPEDMFSLLLAEAKDACFQYLRQTQMQKDMKRAYRQGSHARHDSRQVKDRQPRRGFGRAK